jgi:hypothetical protein
MKPFVAAVAALAIAQAFAFGATARAAATPSNEPIHRYVVESTSPPSIRGKAKANDQSVGVRWLRSYSSADKQKTYSLYEAPSARAICRRGCIAT